jgi:hypothetical protein
MMLRMRVFSGFRIRLMRKSTIRKSRYRFFTKDHAQTEVQQQSGRWA